MPNVEAAREWCRHARLLIKLGRVALVEKEIAQLRNGLQQLTSLQDDQDMLAPELVAAMQQLSTMLSPELELGAELSNDDQGMKRMVSDFSEELADLRDSLAAVLTDAEHAGIELALELAEDHCKVRQFESAMALLQKAWHRAKAVESEQRQPSDPGSAQAELTPEEAMPALQQAGQAIAKLLAGMEPLPVDLQIQCAVFANLLHQQTEAQTFRAALGLLQAWTSTLEDTQKSDEQERLLRARLQQAEDERLAAERQEQLQRDAQRAEDERLAAEDKLRQQEAERLRVVEERQQQREHKRQEIASMSIDTAGVLSGLTEAVERARQRLQAICRQILSYGKEPAFDLEADTGRLAFEVERYYPALPAQGPLEGSAARDYIATKDKADAALQQLQALQAQGELRLAEQQRRFTEQLAAKKKLAQDFGDEQDRLIALQDTDIAAKRKALNEFVVACGELKLKSTDGKVIQNLFSEHSRKFYADLLKEGKASKAELKVAGDVTSKHLDYDALAKPLQAAEKVKGDLQQARKNGLAALAVELENAKQDQSIGWDDPAEIVFGTPLSATQLNARLSADSGTLDYFFDGKPVVPGKTVLPVGDGHILRAEVKGSDLAVFKKTPPKEVTIKVGKASMAIAVSPSIEFTYGTRFSGALVPVVVTTNPSVEREHAAIASSVIFATDQGPLAKDTRLPAGQHIVTVKTAEHASFHPAPEQVLKITVKPAQLAIDWDGPEPTTFFFGAGLTAQQLNAKVRVTSEPALPDMLQSLTRTLRYTDAKGAPVALKSLLPAGAECKLTVNTADNPNFTPAEPRHAVFKVEKAVREIGSTPPGPIGAVVQSSDLQALRTKFVFLKGAGRLEFHIGKLRLQAGVELPVGDKQAVRAVAVVDDNYQPTADKEEFVDVVTFEATYQSAKEARDDLLGKKVHTEHTQALAALSKKVEELGAVTPAEQFKQLNALREEIAEIQTRLQTWQGAVPSPQPSGDGDLLKVKIDLPANASATKKQDQAKAKTSEAVLKLVKHGGITLANVEKMVPKGSADDFTPSGKYAKGFKYIFTTPSGVEVEVYGHGPTIDPGVDPASDSKKGNLVRVKIDGKYLLPDGTLTFNAKDETSHMALY